MYISVISTYVFLCVFGNNIKKLKFCDLIGRLNLGNVCYHVVQNILSLYVLSENTQTRMYKTVILSTVIYGCETWSLRSTE